MAKRDITGVVDFAYLETYAGGDETLVEEVLNLFREQAAMWSPMLDAGDEGWRDAVHTIKGTARGIGAHALGDACEQVEARGPGALPLLHTALDAALGDIAAYQHEIMIQSLRPSSRL